ncbi:hypothetical protein TVD_01725 [Thioalkalivibrio versutus]|uniref:DUF4112 domain-containing protein n=1 Tax=Thioalkalivibrio versutus TaxID=106634 RepID=A0A0G3FZ24_9GAMM|nr:DUF4112 domain-containing protein [Thioalkalivibrio versutus]AKJ94168.1 hypothetical protein TVD_01725 [Thioalkalivibrio versutus]
MSTRSGDPRESTAKQQASLRRLAHILDTAIPLPGGYRIGLDGLIGLIPGIGDLIGAVFSSYIIGQAYQLGAPRMVLLRMGGNVAVDTIVGVIPMFGDLFDFAWKSNRRNVALLDQYLANPRKIKRRSTALMIGLTIGLVAVAIAIVYAVIHLLVWVGTSLA